VLNLTELGKTERARMIFMAKQPLEKVKKAPVKAAVAKGKLAPREIAAIIGLFVIIIAIAGAIAYQYMGNASQSSSFLTFRSNFDAAPSVSIYAVGANGTALSSVIGCSTQIIEQLIRSNSAHRNASTIHYYVMNSTVCQYSQGVLGSGTGAYVNATPDACLALGASAPRIFVNYSAANNTFVSPMALYIRGNAAFMAQCAVASEITAG
jgi:hypothetical protein